MRTPRFLFCLTLFTLMGMMRPASAATLVTSLLDQESDIVNTGGALISAANFGEAAVSVNGIAHVAGSAGDTNLTLGAGGKFEGDFRNGQSGIGGSTEILLSGIMGFTGGANVVFNVGGLTPGTEYLFQAYHEGWPGEAFTFTAEGDSVNFSDQSPATLISYTFVATDTVLNLSLDKTGTGSPSDGNAWLSGYSLQVIPEPASTLLLGLAAFGLLAHRRR